MQKVRLGVTVDLVRPPAEAELETAVAVTLVRVSPDLWESSRFERQDGTMIATEWIPACTWPSRDARLS